MRIAALVAAIAIAFSPLAARADDASTAQRVIRAQEQAFIHDDAATAYSYAAPAIKQIFPSPEIFMAMVQNGYAPVYRHKSFEFGDSKTEGRSVAQRVHIIDANGEAWEALYTLEQQADGNYEITGCSLLKAGQAV
ncbi:protein of unknown function [Bradyrhizobium sp. Ghvi]|uniref:DUF4864 domain-containing protein n=1 Tax=Bradyrhizobium sp. Ghvi TaxID=1855319 RepID=UPI0008F0CCC6|nr:DUF4864 domain-containing protein [Bradyrhizobium sp. Ghvi]SFP98374.1 protein of unknown function [Bradyrhizobium sp. Ghvi]